MGTEGAGLSSSRSKCAPLSPLVELTVNPSFFPAVPGRKPRTECGCQPVNSISSCAVAPPGRFSRAFQQVQHQSTLAARAGVPLPDALGHFLDVTGPP
jgi:hypothetical protein